MGLRKTWKRGDQFLVRHKDADLVVVEKAAGLLTVPTPSARGDDLIRQLGVFLGTAARPERLHVVHRLDRTVSGLLVVARHAKAHDALVRQFAEHKPKRKYVAAVEGHVRDEAGTFISFLSNEGRTLRMRSVPEAEGKKAVTHFKVLERFKSAGVSLVEVTLETGLRNQIRVHFSEAGHPILGELKYAQRAQKRAPARQGVARIFLHAKTLAFEHPRRKTTLEYESALPPDLSRWLQRLGKSVRSAPRCETRHQNL